MPEKYDISGEIDMIVKNVPYNLEPIEIVRWIYLKLGSIFSYNLKILTEYEKSIVEIYHIVFNEYPDFSKKEDRQRCKYLLCNLYVLGMFNYFDVDFNCFNGKIVSFSLNNEFDRLCGYGKIDFTSIKFKPDYLEKLNSLSTSLNLPLEQLKMLAISSYNGKYVQDYEESYSR